MAEPSLVEYIRSQVVESENPTTPTEPAPAPVDRTTITGSRATDWDDLKAAIAADVEFSGL